MVACPAGTLCARLPKVDQLPAEGSNVMRTRGAGDADASTRVNVTPAYCVHSVAYFVTLFCWLAVPAFAPGRNAYVMFWCR